MYSKQVISILVLVLLAIFGVIAVLRWTGDGQSFTEDISDGLDKADLIRIEFPRPNQVIASPLEVKGEARGNWYFEASFPWEIRDETGKVIAQSYAQAQGEWMTTDFVPFLGTVEFINPLTTKGTLILRKDNPSGLPQFDDELIVPIKFVE